MSGCGIDLIAFHLTRQVDLWFAQRNSLAQLGGHILHNVLTLGLALEQSADLTGSVPSDTNTATICVTVDGVLQKSYPSSHQSEHCNSYTDTVVAPVEFHRKPRLMTVWLLHLGQQTPVFQRIWRTAS